MSKLYFGDGTSIEVGADSSNTHNRVIPWKSVQHRGCAINVTEETLPAFYESKLLGFDMVEVDVLQTSDEVCVLSHSTSITGTDSNGNEQTLSVSGSTLAELKAITLDTSVTYGDNHICTLEEALDLCYYYGLGMSLDSIGSVAEAEKIANLVVNHGMGGKCVYVMVFKTDVELITNISKAILEIDHNAVIWIDYDVLGTGLTSTSYDSITTDHDRIAIATRGTTDLAVAVPLIRASGYKLYMWEGSTDGAMTAQMPYKPDYLQFEKWMDTNTINSGYVDTLDFGKGII